MPPVIVPIVQLKVLVVVDVSAIFVDAPLQIVALLAVVTTGFGFTVTVIVYGDPGQPGVAVDVGVTRYCTVPEVELLGLVSVCPIVAPDDPEAPVILPVIAPTVHVNVLGAVAVNAMLVAVPLQIAAVLAVVTAGVGLTVTVIVYGAAAGQLPPVDVGVTIYSTVPAVALLGLVSV
jgi:hypothetical protein